MAKYEVNQSLYGYVKTREQWAQQERASYERAWERNRQIYRNDMKSVFATGPAISMASGGKYYAVINRTANAIDTKHAMLTENAVRPVVTPHTNSDPCQYMLKKSAAKKMPGAPVGMVLEEEQYEALMQMQGPPQIGPYGQPIGPGFPIFSKNDFYEISNDSVAEILTTEIQAQWIIGHCDDWLSRSNHTKLVIGHCDAIMTWDEKKMIGIPKTLHAQSTWIDPLAENYWNANFAIMKQKLRVNIAMARWPEAAEMIENHVRSGIASEYREQDEVAGEFVEYITMWERDSEIGMDEDDALEGGHVMKLEDGSMMSKKGVATVKGDKNWPTFTALRQVEMIDTVEIYDGPASFGDIPLSRNLNRMAVDSPSGIGDPEALLHLQDLYNRLFTIIHEHLRFFAHPTQIMPASVFNELKGLLDKAFSMPGLKIPVRDQLWNQNGGKVMMNLEMPELNEACMKVLQSVSDEIDRLSGITNVLQGSNDSMSAWSGSLYQQATANARGPVGAIARNTQYFLQHLTRVWMGLILDNLTPEEWARRNRQYPPEVYAVIKSRASELLFDVEINVSGASPKAGVAQQLSTMAQSNPALSQSPTFIEQLMAKSDVANGEKIAEEMQQAQQQQSKPQ